MGAKRQLELRHKDNCQLPIVVVHLLAANSVNQQARLAHSTALAAKVKFKSNRAAPV